MSLVWLVALVVGGTGIWFCAMAYKAVCLIAEEHGAKVGFGEITDAMDRLIRRKVK